jgi:hypothetical protein
VETCIVNEQIKRAISESSRDFLRFVWPAIGAEFGEVIPVETVTANSFAAELDRRAGIDIWLVGNDEHMRGLASRVQWVDKSWDTFTIRIRSRYGNPTEYHKRKGEIATPGAISPYYVTQGYVNRDRERLLGAAIARMPDVIAAIDHELGYCKSNGDGTEFYVIPWAALNVIRVWHPDNGQISLFGEA